MPRLSVDLCGGANAAAFLDMIAWSEIGPQMLKASDDGYNVIVGSKPGALITFSDYSRHPNRLVRLNPNLASTAAGRYQLLHRYYQPYADLLHLLNFAPEAQDKIALQQMKERGAINLLKANRWSAAVKACSNIWASLPGAGYGQHENKTELLRVAYINAGGIEVA